ncbi:MULTISPECIES: DUF6615 family protein [Archaeoglobus]|jgi:hypothetical protein|uniref:Uncharacterized protein n=2 Tax=Archaeoglobus fulgidus TaxID=2234 RepID=A0A075WGB7_ARCFL|nr:MULTISPECIES: DUF6615 family protein [Archaeoglobus]AIG99026.1 hypothetical protein AFULGI_00023030 [Archaeoglobus fulgidus DSM 8774]KUJ92933.1 MAG: hypothetical protein XD40_1858 [Archaeoglobus fulgidus]KUK06412.1 MAG: hypothetical protein XD48_1339 [Archaeoglobus fulgidus]MDI3498599.1 hypothetical protein [Archaeoglobus sp.]
MREKFCKAFKNLSTYVWNLIMDSQYYGLYWTSNTNISRGLGFGEESISDGVILKIAKNLPLDIISIKFGKTLEAQEGADWEWWILSGSGVVGLRLQAKRVHIRRGVPEYTYLDYRSNNSYQVDTLIQRAITRGLFPLYIFYNWWDLDFQYKNYINPNIPKCCRVNSSSALGITIASAWEIRNLVNNNRKSLPDVLPVSYPLSCLFCCTFSDISESVYKFIKKYLIRTSLIDEKKDSEVEIKIHKELPDYIYQRLKGEFEPKDPMYTLLILDSENPHSNAEEIKKLIR